MKIWEGIILLMAIFNAFAVPLEFVLDLSSSQVYRIADLVINILFLIDIVISFRTSFINSEGEEVRDLKKIAKRYLRGMFIVDLLSSIPYSYLGLPPNVRERVSLFKILKI